MFRRHRVFFFFNDTATTEIYTLSLHDALPIFPRPAAVVLQPARTPSARKGPSGRRRSEEHTSELQSRLHLVCRLLLEKKKNLLRTRFQICHYIRRRPTKRYAQRVCTTNDKWTA